MDNKIKENLHKPIQLAPEYRDYVWGGSRLRPGVSPTAEAWVVYEMGEIITEPFTGKSLALLAKEYPQEVLGSTSIDRSGARFPLLIKILDSAEWLSLQVHPNNEQALRLEGAGELGKTEAWHVIEADSDAHIIAGFRSGTDPESVRDAIRSGNILDYTQELPVKCGETLFIQPGTLHSIGPGLLLYEVQQSSNLTYRVYDWGRPQIGGRVLHIDKSLEVVDFSLHPQMIPLPDLQDGDRQVLVRNPFFILEMLYAQENTLKLDTQERSFHVVTVLAGSAIVKTAEGRVVLNRFDTALIPAACGEYEISASKEPVRMLLAYVD